MNANWIFSVIFSGLMLPVMGQQSLESNFRTTGPGVVAAFESQRQVLQTSSAVMLDGRKEIGYGVVISADGYVLAKASEIGEIKGLSVTIDQTNYPNAKVLLIDPTWDVALVKVEATGLVPVVYAATSAVPQGSWVMANGATTRTNRRLLAGIISAKIREIPASGGAALGVTLSAKSKALEIDDVSEKSGAHEAGLQKGDVILEIEGKKVGKIEDITELLKDRKEGSMVKLTYRRKNEQKTVEVRLAARGELFNEQMNRNDQMSGDFSPRRSGFPRVMQHDVLGSRQVEGGPLLDLDGHCIGMNIARASRAENYSIPVEELKEIAARMMKQAAGN
ncbi:MAG: PDZ domain-containing protein [Luteolibacter sp.]